MILKEVAITDFRSFAGTHRFDLEPIKDGNQERPIVLFGGLNGAGKTSLLTAVRLGLYGKLSLGGAVTAREYHDFLANCIHKNADVSLNPDSSRIELLFTYARQGVTEEFKVVRTWALKGKTVSEELQIFRDGEHLSELGYDQAQAFLNELIPIGVSSLFFFDGEKIAELAEDDSGEVLRHAVKKLLGLDIIERLNNDLGAFLRREKTKALPSELREEIAELEQAMARALQQKDEYTSEYEGHRAALKDLERQAEQAERRLTERGGQWARTRDAEIQRQNELIAQKRHLEKTLLSELAGAYPLSIAGEALSSLIEDLETAAEQNQQREFGKMVSARLDGITAALEDQLSNVDPQKARQVLQEQFEDLFVPAGEPDPAFDISQSQLQKYKHWAETEIPRSAKRVKDLKHELQNVEEELAQSSLRLERAPDEATLEHELAQLKALTSKAAAAKQACISALSNIKTKIREAMELNRKVQTLQGKLTDADREDSALDHAQKAREVLTEFSQQTATQRVKQLEKHFIESYARLARKEDISISAHIDPDTFDISLIDESGNRISKKDISAGEKQIYAIATLEALARTSGRKLPLIIDTPLGRLDSHHRDKIVYNYLPRASHQVVVLSTDTEIDWDYYEGLQRSVSHAYHVEFDQTTRSSHASEGYFWPHKEHMEAS